MQQDRFISRNPTGVVWQRITALIVWGLLVLFNEGRAVQYEKDVTKASGGNAPSAARPWTAISATPGFARVEFRQTTPHYCR
ncbi:hypothetical protein [Salinibacter ruber]|uniref:hypothetical protein n=1 Tax=Salinibacter ruber TaxID=146919 RepID=UPI003C6E9042